MFTEEALQRVIDMLSIKIIECKQEARELDCDNDIKDDLNLEIDQLDYVRDILDDVLKGKR
jgi:DNA-binding transcriptional regulator GbsR (MarR family)